MVPGYEKIINQRNFSPYNVIYLITNCLKYNNLPEASNYV